MSMQLHHLAMRSADVTALAAFYCEVFSMKLVRDARPKSQWLGLGGEAVLMIETREAGEPAPAAGSLELVAFRVDEAGKAAIRRKAVERDCFDGETQFTVYLRDPEGRRVAVSTYDLAATTN